MDQVKMELFCRKLAHLMGSGVPLLTSLDILIQESREPAFSAAIKKVVEKIQDGKLLVDAMSGFPQFFSKAFLGMIKAAEKQGTVDIMMGKIADGIRDGLIKVGNSARPQEIPKDSQMEKLVDRILNSAVEKRASDIHLVPTFDEMIVSFRIDGTLREEMRLNSEQRTAIRHTLKEMANCDLLSQALPQDSRFVLKKNIDVKLSVLPTCLGEKLTLQLLEKESVIYEPEQIFLKKKDLSTFKELIGISYGLVVFSGRTGSGKTTTAYCALNALLKRGVSVATAEDSVEYIIEGATQTQIMPEIHLNYHTVLSAIMRNDPDVVYISQVRDEKTLEMAINIALTGHLVFIMLSSFDISDTFRQLLSYKVPSNMLSSALAGVISQRLIRKVCPKCAKSIKPSSQELKKLGISSTSGRKFFDGKGCKHCNQTGFRGRLPLYEMLRPTKDLKDVLLSNDLGKTMKYLKNLKYSTFSDEAAEMVIEGKTSPHEALRVVTDSTVSD